MIVRLLQPSDDRSGFSCGDPDFDSFIRKYAGQNDFKHRVGRTLVIVEDECVIGYATFAVGEVGTDDLPAEVAAGLPKYPCPVLRLARLAVHSRFQGLGIGSQLVGEVLALALRLREEVGCVAVIVDALAERDSFYAELGFVPMSIAQGRARARGTVPMALALSRVEKAIERAP